MRREQFYAKYQHLGVDQRELERKYQAYLREQEEMMFLYEAAQKSSSSSAPGLAGGGGSGGVANFAAVFGEFEGSGYYSYPQSVTADADGYLYTLSAADYEGPPTNALRKISPTGEIVWQYLMQSGASESNVSAARIRISPDGYLYTIFTGGIAKFNRETGDLIWSWLLDNESINTAFISITFLSDGTPVTLSNLYDGPDLYSLLCTWDPVTSAKLSEKSFALTGVEEQYVNADIFNDGEDNIILPIACLTAASYYGTKIIKWSLEADNEVWSFSIDASDYDGSDQDVTGMGIDSQGNVYVNGYGVGLTKFNSSGQLVWARVLDNDSLYGLSVSPEGDCYVFGQVTGTELKVVKVSSAGDLQWSYNITVNSPSSLDNAGWWTGANSSAQYLNGSSFLMASYGINGGPKQELILKVGDQPVIGEYGPFTFSEYNQNFGTVTPTDQDYAVVWDNSSYLTQAPVNLIMSPEGLTPQTIEIINLP